MKKLQRLGRVERSVGAKRSGPRLSLGMPLLEGFTQRGFDVALQLSILELNDNTFLFAVGQRTFEHELELLDGGLLKGSKLGSLLRSRFVLRIASRDESQPDENGRDTQAQAFIAPESVIAS